MSEAVLRNVRVLAIGQEIENKDGEKVAAGKTATLELTPRQAEALALAQSMGEISLSLRSLADAAPGQSRGHRQDRRRLRQLGQVLEIWRAVPRLWRQLTMRVGRDRQWKRQLRDASLLLHARLTLIAIARRLPRALRRRHATRAALAEQQHQLLFCASARLEMGRGVKSRSA